MQIIENSKVKEKIYIEKLDNGLTVMIIPKPGVQKKYMIWGTNYGSNDNEFIVPGEQEKTTVPNGVAHFLEHKMFEQENGTNSLDVLTALGTEANAYTTNDRSSVLIKDGQNGYICGLDNIEEWKKSIKCILENKENYLSINATKTIEDNFVWGKLVYKFTKEYEEKNNEK